MSLISRLRAVVAGDDYLDGELDDFAYDDEQMTRTSAPCRLTVVHWPPLETPTRLTWVVICLDPT